MYPPAEDNYGSESCSLLCLPSQPPVLILATSEGQLHHCLVVEEGEEGKGSQDQVGVPG